MKLNIKTILISILVAIVIVTSVLLAFNLLNKEEKEPVKEKEVAESLDEYGYTLDRYASSNYKELYKSLKELLNTKDYDEREYAKLVSQLFTSDLFTISNKISSSDIGGLQFVYNDFKNDFIKIAQNSLYNNVESDLYDNRTQELPTVIMVNVKEVTNNTFKYKETVFENAYYISLNITYEKDLGYASDFNVVLVKNNNKLEVVKAY
ncbi:MAG: hypothetical protein IJZ36_05315 [Bacilli bacterium]|nr:hypothetical protein [Bacilli bacterium]